VESYRHRELGLGPGDGPFPDADSVLAAIGPEPDDSAAQHLWEAVTALLTPAELARDVAQPDIDPVSHRPPVASRVLWCSLRCAPRSLRPMPLTPPPAGGVSLACPHAGGLWPRCRRRRLIPGTSPAACRRLAP